MTMSRRNLDAPALGNGFRDGAPEKPLLSGRSQCPVGHGPVGATIGATTAGHRLCNPALEPYRLLHMDTDRPPQDDRHRLRTWRGPALAALLVAALVTTVAVLATNPPRATPTTAPAAPGAEPPGTTTAPTGQSSAASEPPTGPAARTPADVLAAPSPDVPRTTETAPANLGPAPVPVDTGMAGTAAQSMRMWLMGDEPVLRVLVDGTDAVPGDDLESDGTPLGFMRVAPSRAERPGALDTGGAYLYGIVGPEVDRIAVLAADAPKDATSGPSGLYPPRGPAWVVASTGTIAPPPDQEARFLWTDLTEGWRAVAIQTAAPSRELTVMAWDADRILLQARQWSTDGSQAADLSADKAPDLDVWDPEPPAPRFGPDGPNGANGPFVASYQDIPGQAAPAALFEGTVGVVNGCVVAGADGEGMTLVFPQSQVGPADPPAVLRFRGKDYQVGDPISVGGGQMTTPPDVPAGCPIDAWSVSPY